jgi:hypothetical protein
LLAVAAFNGNTRRASEFLAGDDLVIPHQTLWNWANNVHLARYEDIRAERLPRVQAAAAERHMELMDQNMNLEAKLLEDLDGKRHELAARDISTAARNAAVGTGVHTDKAQLLNGQPTEIRKHRDAAELLRALKEKAPGLFIEGTVVSEETLSPYPPRRRRRSRMTLTKPGTTKHPRPKAMLKRGGQVDAGFVGQARPHATRQPKQKDPKQS